MTEPAAHALHDQPPTGADGMIVCDRLVRIYSGEGIEVQALQGLDLLIAEGGADMPATAVRRSDVRRARRLA